MVAVTAKSATDANYSTSLKMNRNIDRKTHLRTGPNITACGMILSSDPSIRYNLNPTCRRCQKRKKRKK